MSLLKLIKKYSDDVNEDYSNVKLYYKQVSNMYNVLHAYTKEDKRNGFEIITEEKYIDKYFKLNYGKNLYNGSD